MAGLSIANNVQLSNVSIVNTGSFIRVKFDVSWENSWRVNTGQNNYDGVWVFFKYREKNSTEWKHLFLTGQNNVEPAGGSIFQLDPSYVAPLKGSPFNACQGAIIYRAGNGIGNVSFTNIALGVLSNLSYDIEVRGFAIEMVYIPSALDQTIYLGDGDGTNESRNAFHKTDNTSYGYTFTHLNDVTQYPFISIDSVASNINNQDDEYIKDGNDGKFLKLADSGWITLNGTSVFNTNKSWPTSQDAWCMKYELSSAAYCDFLNTLSLKQQNNRTYYAVAPPTSPAGTRALTNEVNTKNAVVIKTPSVNGDPAVYGCDGNGNGIADEADDGQCIAVSHLILHDINAYMDWAGLSLMTEVLYERICRGFTSAGPSQSVYGEFAWGNNQVANGLFTISNYNTAEEKIANQTLSATFGYANYGGATDTATRTSPKTPYALGMPMRNGIFAALPGGSNRITSGASFYGVMELSGNLQEFCVALGNDEGRSFRGWHGDGVISEYGNATTNYWPYSVGTVLRGGSYYNSEQSLRVSDRGQGRYSPSANQRFGAVGGRGVLYRY